MKRSEPVIETLSEIKAEAVYPLAVFQRKTGLGRHAIRTARMNGLKVKRVGGRPFISGDDFLRFFAELAVTGGEQ